MTVRVYRATDASAPALDGTVGSFIRVLKACLVDGYGATVAAGWGMPFEDVGTNVACFRPGAGNRRYLRVFDNATTTARMLGYEEMTGHSTGTGPFPTDTQFPGGLWFYKTNAAGAGLRNWLIVATEHSMYFFGQTTAAPGTLIVSVTSGIAFVDIISYKAEDPYNTLLVAAMNSGTSGNRLGILSGALGTMQPGHYMARTYTGVGGSINVGKFVNHFWGNAANTLGTKGAAYPDPISGRLNMGKIFINEAGNLIRGHFPGLYNVAHDLPAAIEDTLAGTGALTGKTFLLVPTYSSTTQGRAAIEISDTW